MSPVYAFESGAVNLGTIGAIVKPKRQHARREGIEHDAEGTKHEEEKEDGLKIDRKEIDCTKRK